MKTEGPPQLLCFIPGKIGHDHGNLEHLLLEKRNTQSACQDRLQSRIEILHFLAAGPPGQVRMHHVALDRAGSDNGDLDDHIVKTFRFQARQGRHLGAAFDLKNTDGVGFLHHLKRGRIVLRNMGQIERTPAFAAQFKRVLHDGHHAQAEQIDFHDAEIFTVVLVPLRHHASRHGGILQRHKRAQFILTNDHAAGVLTEMAGQPIDGRI